MTICEHIKDNGSTCGSPALKGEVFCFFHQRLRLPRHRPGDFEYKLPILDNPQSILMAIQHITQAALDGILEPSRARLVLSALRLAMATLKAMKKEERKEDVEKKSAEKETNPACLSSRAPLLGEGSASAPIAIAVPGTHNSSNDRGRAGLQPRVEGRKEIGALAPVGSAAGSPKQLPLSATQLKLMKKILRRGPSDPRFATAARLLDHQIAAGHN